MSPTLDLPALNARLRGWQSKPRLLFLIWSIAGLIGTATGISQLPLCLSLGNIIGFGVFGSMAIFSCIFAIIRWRMIQHYEKVIARYPC